MIKMAVRLGGRTLETYNFSEQAINIGRDSAGDIFLDNPAISRHHATVFLEDSKLMIKDEGSANGTFVNGNQITTMQLNNGDSIAMGKFQIVVGYTDPNKEKPILNYGGGTLAIDSSVVQNIREAEQNQASPEDKVETEIPEIPEIPKTPEAIPETPVAKEEPPISASQVFTQSMVKKTNPTPYVIIGFLLGIAVGFVLGMTLSNAKTTTGDDTFDSREATE